MIYSCSIQILLLHGSYVGLNINFSLVIICSLKYIVKGIVSFMALFANSQTKICSNIM